MTPELRDRLAAILERPHRLGMIGGELDRQLDHCQAFLEVVNEVAASIAVGGEPAQGLDLGTGGGIPGLVLAAARPDMAWALVDSRTSRATEVERCVAKLGMHDRVQVVAAPAQQLAHDHEWRAQFSLVVARSFGPPSFTAECASGFLRPGGSLIVSEPPGERSNERWSAEGLAACGFGPASWVERNQATFAHMVRLDSSHPADLPRLPPRTDRGWPKG